MAPLSHPGMVTIKFAKPDVQPPVYVAGSFSDPAWLPQEMEYTIKGDGQREYVKDIPAEEGKEYQYKFRLGPGDWWILDEASPTVTDDIGNRNNLLSVPVRQQDTTRSVAIEMPSSRIREVKELGESVPGKIGGLVDLQPRAGRQDNDDIQQWTTRRELVDVVAAAVLLDDAQHTPPMSDGDVGEIGGRRMSDTPISQAERIAAEAAEVAALPEEKSVDFELPPSPLNFEDGRDLDSYPVTPGDDQVPLFPHECPGPTDKVVESPHEYIRAMSWSKPVEEVLDLKDPSLVPFPTDRDGIMAQLRDVERRNSSVGPETPPFPPFESNHYPDRLEIPSPSIRSLTRDQSPSLHSIVEEQEVGDAPLTSIPNLSDLLATPEKNKFLDPAYSDDIKGEVSAIFLDHPQPIIHVAKANLESGVKSQFLDSQSDETPQEHPAPRVGDEVVGFEAPVEEERSHGETLKVLESPPIATVVVQATSPHINDSKHLSEYKIKASEVDFKRSEVQLDPTTQIEGASVSSSNVEIPADVASPKFNNDLAQRIRLPPLGEVHPSYDSEPSTTDATPSATIQPATQWSNTMATLNGSSGAALDTGESTSIAHRPELKPRKQPPQVSPLERPLTPSSIRSSNKDAKSRSFLKAFWRVVFVDWIGGFILRLCGGGRHT
ncbi:uncharacterized protein BP5553_07551 [Venustampulla echinocandica]|uniref:AMP-activated protein kinase glycogen-binding domain-containing protein n=1 Tax=Venustampulla echinocandica TaxID=2656787 RepID=A0A370TGV7_9HELO|nr:uncharacterized protein BP5553_07551 [Venustampulla echinocandica]RDL34423.1 hypothetical protein BP5553_07551 [Venustampulla echinocandica]